MFFFFLVDRPSFSFIWTNIVKPLYKCEVRVQAFSRACFCTTNFSVKVDLCCLKQAAFPLLEDEWICYGFWYSFSLGWYVCVARFILQISSGIIIEHLYSSKWFFFSFFLRFLYNKLLQMQIFVNVHCERGCESEDLSYSQEILDIRLYETSRNVKFLVSFLWFCRTGHVANKCLGFMRCFKLNFSLLYFQFCILVWAYGWCI